MSRTSRMGAELPNASVWLLRACLPLVGIEKHAFRVATPQWDHNTATAESTRYSDALRSWAIRWRPKGFAQHDFGYKEHEPIVGARWVSLLFCNIAWMKDYAGRSDKDPPLGGGAFPRSEGYCGEECNFVPCEDGYVYGHFETIKGERDRQVRIERLGASRTDDFLDGVDVVWTAPTNGKDPRAVVGWSRKARVYRWREQFNDHFPSVQHRKDKITSFHVKARAEDVFLLPPDQRTMRLRRGHGWSGQTSWWYADETTDAEAMRFVEAVKALMNEHHVPSVRVSLGGGKSGRKGPAGAAASEAYRRYVKEFEATIHPRHHKLQEKFRAFLCQRYLQIDFPQCFRDDLRYAVRGEQLVMVEVKPTDRATLRFAIRTAIGQLLDYGQHEQWTGRRLILVETEVTNADDRRLAFDNGFGLAWPEGTGRFKIRWPR